jgi:hypothetical protein
MEEVQLFHPFDRISQEIANRMCEKLLIHRGNLLSGPANE